MSMEHVGRALSPASAQPQPGNLSTALPVALAPLPAPPSRPQIPVTCSYEKTFVLIGNGQPRINTHYPEGHKQRPTRDNINQDDADAWPPVSGVTLAYAVERLGFEQCESADCLLTLRDMSSVEVEVDWGEHTALSHLDENTLSPQALKSYSLNHSRCGSPANADRSADIQPLAELQHQHHARLKLLEVEKKLLSRALSIAKKRHNGESKRTTFTPTNSQQHMPTLGGYLREEIAAHYLQAENTSAGIQRIGKQLRVTSKESERTQPEVRKKPQDDESIRQQLEIRIRHLSDKHAEDTEQLAAELNGEIAQLKIELETSRSQHIQALAEQKLIESDLQASLAESKRTIDEAQLHANTQIAALHRRIEDLESSQKQLLHEKSQLADSLKAEIQQARKHTQRAQRLEENSSILEAKLEAQRQVLEDTATKHRTEMSLLKQDLEQALRTIEELEATRKHQVANLESTLEQTQRSAHDRLSCSKSEIASLLKQKESYDSSLQQLTDEKEKLASCLQIESSRVKEFAHRAESLDEHRRNLERELETTQQDFSETKAAQMREIDLVTQQLTQLNQALDAEKLKRKRERVRISNLFEKRKGQIKSIRSKAIRQHKKRLQAEAMLAQERENAEHLKSLIQSTKEQLEIANIHIKEYEQEQKDLEDDLQKKTKTAHEAWDKATQSDIALDTAKLEFSALKVDMKREIDHLQAQLVLHDEQRAAIQKSHDTETAQLRKSLDDHKTTLISAETTIRALKSDRQSVRDDKFLADKKIAELEKSSLEVKTNLTRSLESSQQDVFSLQQELADIKKQMIDPVQAEHLRQALQKAKDEITQFKRKIAGLSEVLLEMERRQDRDQDTEITKLLNALIEKERKLQISDDLTRQNEPFQRQLSTQELNIELLNDDLDSGTRAKDSLLLERDRLHNESSAISEV